MAGITHLAEFQEAALRGLVDESVHLREENPTFAQKFLPNLNVYSTNFAYDIVKQSKHMAAFIGYGAEPPVMDRDAVATKFGSLAAFGLQYVATVEELMALNQARSNGERAALVEKLERKAVDISEGIQDFADVLRAQALTMGKLNYTDGEVKISFDYQVPTAHKIALVGGETFDNTTADILGKLIEWNETYIKSNGKKADVMLIPSEIMAHMTKNASIIAEARPGVTGVTRISTKEVLEVLEGFDLPTVEIVRTRTKSVTNMYTGEVEAVEFFPANRIVFISEGLGNFYYGPNPEADNFEPGIIVKATDEDRPRRSILEGYAAGFPVIEKPSLLLHADVLA